LAFTKVQALLVLSIAAIVIGLGAVGVRQVQIAAVRSQSTNNLKQIGIALNGLATRTEGLWPPSVGAFPARPSGASIFFHIMPDIEANSIFSTYHDNYDALESDEVRVKTYQAPLDPTNPPTKSTLTSYASNAAIFSLQDGGGPARYPRDFQKRGTSNYVIFMERFAVVGPSGTRHTWPSRAKLGNYLYPPTDDWPGPEASAVAQFGVDSGAASNEAPHAFVRPSLQVGLADGSARAITRDVTRTFSCADGQAATIWAWACSLHGPLGEAETPKSW
jgi:hypothetical protein